MNTQMPPPTSRLSPVQLGILGYLAQGANYDSIARSEDSWTQNFVNKEIRKLLRIFGAKTVVELLVATIKAGAIHADQLKGDNPQVIKARSVLFLSTNEEKRRALKEHVANSSFKPLGDRETQVIRLAYDGLSDEEIARQLSIGIGTVKSHLRAVSRKLGACDIAQAIQKAIQAGYINPD